jgi:hypothetical protein
MQQKIVSLLFLIAFIFQSCNNKRETAIQLQTTKDSITDWIKASRNSSNTLLQKKTVPIPSLYRIKNAE